MPFVHLRVHTEFSLNDGIVRIDPPKRKGGGAGATLTAQAAKLGYPAVAVTDRGNLFAMVKFFKSAEYAGIKPITGADLWLRERSAQDGPERLTLLVANEEGYANLTRLVSLSYTQGQVRGQPLVDRDALAAHSAGLIALSGRDGGIFRAALADQADDALAALTELQQLFPQRLYLDIARCGRPGDEDWVQAACALSRHAQVPVVASNDVRFLLREDFAAHEARVCIADGRLLGDEKRPRTYTEEQYLKSPEEMAVLFADLPQALQNSVEIARRCTFAVRFAPPYHLPNFPVPDGHDADSWLREEARNGLQRRFEVAHRAAAEEAAREAIYLERLDYELDIIQRMGFAGYFLVVADFIAWAKTHGCPVGPGRGSGAGSLVAYAIGITDLDPLPYNLLFERFLNPERVSMPDFDVDFCMDNRDRVIEYVSQKYGRDHVSQIITYATMAARGVIRDVARVLGHGYGFGDSIAKLVPGTPGATLEDALESVPELRQRYETEEDTRAVIDLGLQLEGITRGVGIHAGGVVIAPRPLTDYTPVYCESGGVGLRTQFDMKDLEAIGLVKFDFLGLRTLTIIQEAVDTVNRRHPGESLDMLKLPLTDAETYRLYASGNTTAVFQMESPGMQKASRDLKPDCFEDIVALVSLYRPGPMENIPEFCARKRGEFPVNYLHPDMEPVLQPTYGIFVYQEQVMQMSQRLAGYTLGGADLLRRAMGKKIKAEMDKQRDVFVRGATARGVDGDTANAVFDLMAKFADYGFNKSHAAAYALVSYQTAWLKTHHPAPFMAAVMSCEMAHTDAVVVMREECLRMGLKVLPPDVNASHVRFTVPADDAIRYGLGAIKGVGEGILESVVAERERNGIYRDLFDFCRRVDTRKLNRRALEALIFAGALDSFGEHRATLLHNLSNALQLADADAARRDSGQDDLFGLHADAGADSAPVAGVALERMPEWSLRERLEREREALGFYQSGHPLQAYRPLTDQICSLRLAAWAAQPPATPVATPTPTPRGRRERHLFAAWVKDVRFFKGDREAEGRTGRASYKITVEDCADGPSPGVELSCWVDADAIADLRDRVRIDSLVFIDGELAWSAGRDAGAAPAEQGAPAAAARPEPRPEPRPELRLYAPVFMNLDQAMAEYAQALVLVWNRPLADVMLLRRLLHSRRHPQGIVVLIEYANRHARCTLELSNDWRVRADDGLLRELRQLLGEESVTVHYRKHVSPGVARRYAAAGADGDE